MLKKSVYVASLLLLATVLVSCTTQPPPAPVVAKPPEKQPMPAPVIVAPAPPVLPPVYKPPATSFADSAELEDMDSSAERIVMARRSALTSSPIKQRLTREQINECLDILSDTFMMEYDLFLRPFTPFETKLIARIQRTEPPIVARTGLELLRGILKNKALLSPREAQTRGISGTVFTPGVQDKLFGSYDCVIATVGSPDGSPCCGDVIIRLKPSVKNLGWATPWSGMQFKAEIRQLAKKQAPFELYAKDYKGQEIKVDFDDLNHLARYVVIGRDWNRALAYQMVLSLRKMREPNSFASNKTPAAPDSNLLDVPPQAFWQTLVLERGGCFLEAKFPGSLPADYFESIEVNEQDLPIVLAWPEATPYKSIIHGIPAKSTVTK
jgi:hypothetical protein